MASFFDKNALKMAVKKTYRFQKKTGKKMFFRRFVCGSDLKRKNNILGLQVVVSSNLGSKSTHFGSKTPNLCAKLTHSPFVGDSVSQASHQGHVTVPPNAALSQEVAYSHLHKLLALGGQ